MNIITKLFLADVVLILTFGSIYTNSIYLYILEENNWFITIIHYISVAAVFLLPVLLIILIFKLLPTFEVRLNSERNPDLVQTEFDRVFLKEQRRKNPHIG